MILRPIYIRAASASMLLLVVACGGDADAPTGPPATPVTSAVATLQNVAQIERSVGRLHANTAPRIAAETPGRVIEVLAEAGDLVEAGQVLARLDGDSQRAQLEMARGDVLQLRALSQNQQARVERLSSLAGGDLVSKDQYEEAQAQAQALRSQLTSAQARLSAAQLDLQRTEIVSPVAGELETRHISAGDFVGVGDPLFDVVSAEALMAVLPVPQRLAPEIRLGQMVRLHALSLPDWVIEAPITEIRPVVGGRSRAVEAVAALDNPGNWRAGGSVVGEIVLAEREAVVVPPGSVVKRPAGEVVYVVDPESSIAIERVVDVGLRHADWIEIRSGVSAGEAVVLSGAGFLTDQAPLAIENSASGSVSTNGVTQ